ncbi:MAG TPA: protoporphyrinogen oxidase, partial [Candidatus Binatia bacterium]|nr:protoporphyrinogen oxidase [Candidatus Binatia bacterium]
GFVLERGADSMITDKPWGVALCERLGIADRLVGTRAGERRTAVVHDGRLHPLPEGFLLMAPTAMWPVATSPLFSLGGKLRMALDLVLPRRRESGDESLAAFVRRRLGSEALERVADPLVGGIYTADPERLSLAATMPRFLELERRHRSVVLGLRSTASVAPGSAGVRYGLFVAPADGMGSLVEAAACRLPEGVLRLRAPVERMARDADRWLVSAGGHDFDADAVILATPAFAAAALLAPLDDELARRLAGIEYASSATVTLGFRAQDVAHALVGFGFVVPFSEGRPLLACTFASRKYPGRAPEGHELLRAFVGGARRPDLVALDDEMLVRTVRDELRALLGITADPMLVRVDRHRRAMPQYAVGHLDLVDAIEARAAALPGLALAGAAYRGVGIPDCIHGGELAADAVAERLGRG